MTKEEVIKKLNEMYEDECFVEESIDAIEYEEAKDIIIKLLEENEKLNIEENIKPKRIDIIQSMSPIQLAEFLINFKNTFGEEYEDNASCVEWLMSTGGWNL